MFVVCVLFYAVSFAKKSEKVFLFFCVALFPFFLAFGTITTPSRDHIFSHLLLHLSNSNSKVYIMCLKLKKLNFKQVITD